MYNEILTLLLKSDVTKSEGFRHPFALINTKREIVCNFCKKYPWTVSEDFLLSNKLEIVSPKICQDIEIAMTKNQWLPLYEKLVPLPPDKYYPTNYWERLADLVLKDSTAMHIFVDIMTTHGLKFTEGVVLTFLKRAFLEEHTKNIIYNKIYMDKQKILQDLV